jgi:hypothetical protein
MSDEPEIIEGPIKSRLSSLTILAKPVGVEAVSQLWTSADERSLLRTRISATVNAPLCVPG